MKVRVSYTVEVDEPFLRGIRRFKGQKGIAQGKEVKEWYEQYGHTMDNVRWTREQEQAERAARREAVEEQRIARAEKKTRRKAASEVEARAARESDWIRFLNIGFSAAKTECGWCHEHKLCRGKRLSQMACHDCYVEKGAPPVRQVSVL